VVIQLLQYWRKGHWQFARPVALTTYESSADRWWSSTDRNLTSYPGLLTPVFVAAGEALVNSSRATTYLIVLWVTFFQSPYSQSRT